MRTPIYNFINAISPTTLGSFKVSEHLPWEDNGAPIYHHNKKHIYVNTANIITVVDLGANFPIPTSYSVGNGFEFIISKDTDIFFEYLNENNIDKELLNIYTASLFISMCPMHIDSPDRIEKFLDVAEKILKNLD